MLAPELRVTVVEQGHRIGGASERTNGDEKSVFAHGFQTTGRAGTVAVVHNILARRAKQRHFYMGTARF
jgi:hypothetical protein